MVLTMTKYWRGKNKPVMICLLVLHIITICFTYFRQCRGPGGDIRATLAPFTELSCTSEM